MSAETIPDWAIDRARQVRAEGHQSNDWFLEDPHVLAIATAINDAVMAERKRCEVAVAMACHVGKYTPLSEYIAAIRAAPKAEGK